MIKQCVGYKRVEYTNKQNKEVKGYRLFLGDKITSNGDGYTVSEYYVSDSKLDGEPSLSTCKVEFSEYKGRAYIYSVSFYLD